jgi:hypothetical protein
MDYLGKVATNIAYRNRYFAFKALQDHPYFDRDFLKWTRSQQIQHIPHVFKIIQKTMWEYHKYYLDIFRWSQFVQWRKEACASPVYTDTLGSIYTTFVYWNKHTIPKRRSRHTINTLLAIQQHSVDSSTLSDVVVKGHGEDVFDQRVGQSAPTVRIPTRRGRTSGHSQLGKLSI